jgi:hypothetical protein
MAVTVPVAVFQRAHGERDQQGESEVEEREEDEALGVAESGALVEPRLLRDVAHAEHGDEGGVFEQADEIVAERREHAAERLREQHVAQGLAAGEAEGAGGFGLAARERGEAAAEGLGLEGAVGKGEGGGHARDHGYILRGELGAEGVGGFDAEGNEHEGHEKNLHKHGQAAHDLHVERGDLPPPPVGRNEAEGGDEAEGEREREGDGSDDEREAEAVEQA